MKKTFAVFIDPETGERDSVDITDMKPDEIKRVIPKGVDYNIGKVATLDSLGALVDELGLSPHMQARVDAAIARLAGKLGDPNLKLSPIKEKIDLTRADAPRDPRFLN
jgi:hypothetical protein